MGIKSRSVFTQIVMILFLVTSLPVSLITYYNGMNLQQESERTVAGQIQEKLKANSRLSDAVLSNILYLSLDFVLLKKYESLSGVKTYAELNSSADNVVSAMSLFRDFENLVSRNEVIHSVFYFVDDTDYVISSDGCVVRKQEFGDLSWLDEVNAGVSRAQGIWITRKIKDPYDPERGVDVLSYVYRISSIFAPSNGVIVIDVYEDRLNNLITTSHEEAFISGGLLTASGNVLSYNNKSKLYRNLNAIPHIQTMLSSKNENGYFISKDGKEGNLQVYQKSELYDWYYISTYSYNSLFAEHRSQLQKSLLVSVGILLIGSILIVYIAFLASQKMRQLVRQIETVVKSPDEPERSKNEFDYLGIIVEKIKLQEIELNKRLHERENVALRAVIQKLLFGEQISDLETNLLKRKFPDQFFIVCILTVDHLSAYYLETTHEIREYHRWSITEMVKSLFPQAMTSACCRYSSASTAVILNMKEYDEQTTLEAIKDSAKSIQREADDTLNIGLSIGISGVCNSFQQVRVCAEEAYETMKQKMFAGSGQIFVYHPDAAVKQNPFPSYLYEKRIFNYLAAGELPGIKLELTKMVNEIRAAADISLDSIMLSFNQIIGRTILFLNENNYNTNRVFGVQNNLYFALSQNETLEEIEAFIFHVFEAIINYQKKEGAEKEESLCLKVLNYLQEHYQEDVEFQTVADYCGVSYSLLRRVMKQETEKSLIDNLNLIRIQAVKKALLNSNMPIADIALRNGYHNVQALNRFFKKYEGMAPGEYRDKNQSGETE